MTGSSETPESSMTWATDTVTEDVIKSQNSASLRQESTVSQHESLVAAKDNHPAHAITDGTLRKRRFTGGH